MCCDCEHSSVILQGVLDHKANFTDIYVGWPSRVHDARVLKNAQTYMRWEKVDAYLYSLISPDNYNII